MGIENMRFKKMSKEKLDILIDLFKKGVDTVEIARKLDIQPGTVNAYAREMDVKRPEGWKKIKGKGNRNKKSHRSKTPRISDVYRFKPYGDVGLMKSFELDCWHLIRLNEVAGLSTENQS